MNRELKEVERWDDPALQFASVSATTQCCSHDICAWAIKARTADTGRERTERRRKRGQSSRHTRVHGPKTALASPQDIAGTASVSVHPRFKQHM